MCHERNSSLIAWTAAAAQVTFVVSISGSERQLRGSRRWDQGLRWLILEVVGAGSGRRWSLFGISRCLTNHDTDAEAARIRVPDSGFNLLKMLGESRALYKFPQPSLPCFSSPSWHYRVSSVGCQRPGKGYMIYLKLKPDILPYKFSRNQTNGGWHTLEVIRTLPQSREERAQKAKGLWW